jgi:hypothetical protein
MHHNQNYEFNQLFKDGKDECTFKMNIRNFFIASLRPSQSHQITTCHEMQYDALIAPAPYDGEMSTAGDPLNSASVRTEVTFGIK